jgi:CIC family chloride channel protein
VLLFMKPLLCATSLAGGASGGVFAPSLVAGAALGGLFARFVGNALGLDLTASAYVMAGMAAVMGAVMRAPLQAILVTFELTHNYAVIPPLMITCVLALKVSELFEPDSAFTWQLARAGRKLRGGLDFSLLNGLTVADLMDDEFVALPEHAPITELGALIRASENRTFPVLGEDGKLRGIVMLANLMAAASRARASGRAPAVEDLLEPESVWLEPATPLLSAWETMGNYDYDCLPVCRKEHDGLTLLGICEREAILEMHDRQAFVALTAGSSG